ncbi:MAG: 3-dehydroquinate synthase [Lachnospiraceae bacterium]|nr:3-dehydroquinate synthase [Lachnospiraceae bacterium]
MKPLKTLPILYNGTHCYNIELHDSFLNLADSLSSLQMSGKRLCIVSDSNVDALYGEEVQNLLQSADFAAVYRFVFPAGEENKTLDVITDLYEFLIQKGFDRSDVLVALGGGVTGDMTGYAAATYLRGIRFVQIPTSLLSMVDSSIGGKTGVDFRGYKNMVGAFHMPSLVYVNLSVLKTLDQTQRSSGMGEIIKHSLIRDKQYYNMLISKREEILNLNTQAVTEMIFKSQEIKKQVVENDPKEKGERAHLNFGHTIGHAIEKFADFSLLHGHCVGLGMVAASYISFLRGNITKDELLSIEDLISSYGLLVRYKDINNDCVIDNCFHDKKKEGNLIRFVLLDAVGSCYTTTDVTKDEMNAAINYLKGEQQ